MHVQRLKVINSTRGVGKAVRSLIWRLVPFVSGGRLEVEIGVKLVHNLLCERIVRCGFFTSSKVSIDFG